MYDDIVKIFLDSFGGYIPFIVIIYLVKTVYKIFLPEIKGYFGELQVRNILKKLSSEYIVINNIMLRKEDKETTQIDHIVVSTYGIFVIETKNYKGLITGGDYSKVWIEHIYKKKYQFMNPIKQNYGHAKTLEKLLELPKDSFIPIVVFTEDGILKVKTSKIVINTKDLSKTIVSFNNKIIEENQVKIIADKILNENIDSKETRREHIKNVKKKQNETKNETK